MKVAVIGLGYVGIAVAVRAADVGHDVLGIDIVKEKVDKINMGQYPIEGNEPQLPEILKRVVEEGRLRASQSYSDLRDREMIIVSVQTPFDYVRSEPNYTFLKKALIGIGENMQKGAIVSIESTIAPKTIDNVVKPILEETSGMKAGEDFYLVHCPERVMPGRLLKNLSEYGRVLGGINRESAEKAYEFYKTITSGEINITNALTAEIVKTSENTYRDVQIAFANELAMLCERLGADVFEVRELVNKVPYRNVHIPGAGVGGHCLPKDPLLLIYPVREKAKLIPLAREINNYMPVHTYHLLMRGLERSGKLSGDTATIAVLGASYLPGSDDTRNAPTAIFLHHLLFQDNEYRWDVKVHDPYASELLVPSHLPFEEWSREGEVIHCESDLYGTIEGSDAIVLMTAHPQYSEIDLDRAGELMKTKVIIDGRNMFSKEEVEKKGFIYYGVGKPLEP